MTTWPIASLLPHAGDMILIDEVLAHDADSLRARAVIRPGPYSLPDGSLPPWLGLELMAQAIGAWAGCQAGWPARRSSSASCWARAATTARSTPCRPAPR
ncbi:hypothetical protein WJ966_12245 [Achromobacter xylosoxidans]